MRAERRSKVPAAGRRAVAPEAMEQVHPGVVLRVASGIVRSLCGLFKLGPEFVHNSIKGVPSVRAKILLESGLLGVLVGGNSSPLLLFLLPAFCLTQVVPPVRRRA